MAELTGKYRYEQLGEKPFQELCCALLAHALPGIRCFPVGHSDGGRDALLPLPDGKSAVYQVKWTGKPLQDPVRWLTAAVREERANISRLVAEGATAYHLLTSVSGTAVPGRGTIDRLDTELARYSAEFGIPMTVWWRSDLDARLDAAPDELKWSYSAMLSGHDLLRSLRVDDQPDSALRELIRKAVATQWEEDSKVKFKQAELTSHDLVDLFVDVEAVRLGSYRPLEENDKLGGAAAYLMNPAQPFALVRGAPGQGKSTLGQYLCQVHRAALLDRSAPGLATLPPGAARRVPLRVDLRDYAAWLEGEDPLRAQPQFEPTRSLEGFLAYLLRALSGGHPVDVPTVGRLLARSPFLLVLDGLDEVARPEVRSTAVKQIEDFCSRLPRDVPAPQILLTTRPNAAGLAEPSGELFETIELSRLRPELRAAYLQKWATARAVSERDRRELEAVFQQRSAEPHISQLADNPMQLTILLHLLHRRGVSVPTTRTELYTSYLETFLDREAEKSPQVADHRADLEEITAFLGWRLQADAERQGADGRMAWKKLQRTIQHYLVDTEKPHVDIDTLFTAVTERVWALTSKVQGTFEFDIQPMREYFAARFLSAFAGADRRDFDSGQVLRELVRRPYWSEVARFYAGFARPNELAGLADVLAEEKETSETPLQALMLACSLLADGVFSARPRVQRRVVDLFLDDLGFCLLDAQLHLGPDLPMIPPDRGGRELSRALLEAVEQDPYALLAGSRALFASWHLTASSDFEDWWSDRLRAAAGGDDEKRWLYLGAYSGVDNPRPIGDLPLLSSGDLAAASEAMSAGLYAAEGSAIEALMVRAVLAGHQTASIPEGANTATDLLRVLLPHFSFGALPISRSKPERPWQRLVDRDERLAAVRSAIPPKGQPNWGDLAQALGSVFGPCWLAAEAAVIAAVLGPSPAPGAPRTEPFGPRTDYRALIHHLDRHRNAPEWWAEQFDRHRDPLSRATWALALVIAGDPLVSIGLLDLLDQAVTALPSVETGILLRTVSTIVRRLLGKRPRPQNAPKTVGRTSPVTTLLLALSRPDERVGMLRRLSTEQLAALSRFDVAAPSISTVLVERLDGLAPDRVRAVIRPLVRETERWYPETFPERHVALAELRRDILDHPGEYSRDWLLTTQEMPSAALPHLAEVAAAESWFDFE
ncbi:MULTISPECIES: hypothetical protein [Kitasatospora]|uniref:NACHT domain-containing protein n=1 Tax=Kitasatospora setae (strain ATCC 33774 / DSM 43861 / JCM 3304 / KCC A-0304 / NBRC 14216 / KM-6054) TaxID=452652 RepID=E4N772_KITSK|nr:MULTISPECIES: hypothetical protein [Kitasatospora]BAJ27053.1 hypothetical protein KSE_12200 [Kitasatospora setae KM-6054]